MRSEPHTIKITKQGTKGGGGTACVCSVAIKIVTVLMGGVIMVMRSKNQVRQLWPIE